MSVRQFFTRTSLSISVQLGDGHDGARVLLKSGKWLVLRYGQERRKNPFALRLIPESMGRAVGSEEAGASVG